MRFLIGDTETSGLGAQAKAVEMAWIEVDEDLNILGQFASLIDPEQEIQPGAQAIHGIDADMVRDAPTLYELQTIVLPELKIDTENPVTLIAHNVKFDKRYFEPVFNIAHTFCTLALIRSTHPSLPNHKLGTVKEQLGLDGGQAHRAMGDVLTVHSLLKHVLPSTGRTLAQHCATPRRTVYTMPWGQYKDKALSALPRDYRTWLLSIDIDQDLRQSLMQLRSIEL
jgi:DNA polymerase III epsilon subunit-like protein